MSETLPNPHIWVAVKHRPKLANEPNVSGLINRLLDEHYKNK